MPHTYQVVLYVSGTILEADREEVERVLAIVLEAVDRLPLEPGASVNANVVVNPQKEQS